MLRKTWWAALAACAFVGCDNSTTNPATPPTNPTSTSTQPAPGGPGPGGETAKGGEATKGDDGGVVAAPKVVLNDEEINNLKSLPEEDRKLALEQKICPVSGDHLGAEGMTPYKVTVKGQTVMLCCDGCEEAIKSDPDKYLAKLGKGK